MVAQRLSRLLVLLLSQGILVACLPTDSADDSGHVHFTVEGDRYLRTPSTGLVTTDGWMLTFKKYFITLGDLMFRECDGFTDTSYLRVVELVRQEPQKVQDFYALGSCTPWFEIRIPFDDAALGKNVTAADRQQLIDSQSSVRIIGTATRGETSKSFSISMNVDVNLGDCKVKGKPYVLELDKKRERTLPMTIVSGAPFYDGNDISSAALRFDPFAAADDEYGNADDNITTWELARVPLFEIAKDGRYLVPGAVAAKVTNLLEFVRVALAERYIALPNGGSCVRTGGMGDFR